MSLPPKKGFFASRWAQKRIALTELRSSGMVTVSFQGSRILVNVPFDEKFQEGANDLGGRYRDKTGRWSFHHKQRRALKRLIERVYGVERVPPALNDSAVGEEIEGVDAA